MLPSQSTSPAVSVNFNILGKKLLQAAKDGDESEAQSLLLQGAPFISDHLGMSSLHFSCMNGHAGTTELLARSGVSWQSRTKADKTPLHYAAQNGFRDVVNILVNLGADINAVDMLQMTPLHWAVVEAHFLVIKLLVEHNADLTIKNKFDKTAIETAEDSCNFHIVEFLKSSTNCQSYDNERPVSPTSDSSQAVLASFAALCGSPSLTENFPWLGQDSNGCGSHVLLESANMVTLTEGGKMALQAWSNLYDDESTKIEENETNTANNKDGSKKVLSSTVDTNNATAPSFNNSNLSANQPIRVVISSGIKFKTKENGLAAMPKKKRKLAFQEQLRSTDIESDPVEMQRKLEEAQLEAEMYRAKLMIKEEEICLWKRKLEKSLQHRT